MPSLQEYRRGFMNEVPFVGDVIRTGVQETPPDGPYIGTVDTADAKRIIASSDLADTGRTSTLEDTASDFYQGSYAYIPDGPIQRRVTDKGYVDHADATDMLDITSTVDVGYLILNRDLAAAVAPDTEVEIHPLLPVLNADRLPGINVLINRALDSMSWTRHITLTGNAGNRYSMAAYPEVMQGSQVTTLTEDPSDITVEPNVLGGTGHLEWNGNIAYLILDGFQSSGVTFGVKILIPASAWIKTGGTWAASAAGLVHETDEAMPPVNQVVTVARFFAFDALAEYAPSEALAGKWNTARDRVAAAAYQLMRFNQPEVSRRNRSFSRLPVGSINRRSWP